MKSDMSISFIVGDYGQPTVETRDGVPLYAAYRPNSNANLLERGQQMRRLYSAIRSADADIYVFRGHPQKAAITYLLTTLADRSWVYNLANDSNVGRDIDQLSYPLRVLLNRAISNAEQIIAQTDYQRQQLLERFGVDAQVVPNGYPVASDQLSYSNRSGFVWIGRLNKEQKRPHLYLDLADRIPDKDFSIIGSSDNDPQYYEQIRDRARSMENVEFIGEVSPEGVHQHYRESKALINTSDYEGFPNTFLESWRQGTPVVSYSVDTSRYIEISHPGYCNESFDCLVKKSKAVSSNQKVWEKHSIPAREYFESNYSIGSTALMYKNALLNGHTK